MVKGSLKISVRAGNRRVPYSFRNLDRILLGPPALFGCKVFSRLITPSSVTIMGSISGTVLCSLIFSRGQISSFVNAEQK